MKKFAIIAAGGIGKRMGGKIPKQFLLLCGLPVLMHTITAFHRASSEISIILALPRKHIKRWNQLCRKYRFTIPCKIVAGGDTRTQTIFNCLKILPNKGLVAIHDGVRPLIHSEIILKSYRLAGKKGSAVVAVPLKDSIRKISKTGKSNSVNRESYGMVQTPQTFRIDWLKEAYQSVKKGLKSGFTDDASVFEKAGFPVFLLKGDYNNLKITTNEDLAIAEWLTKRFGGRRKIS
ncbi:MAG: 2-C-methyl-D-erythritol 4-phosphate cytidylyltransferase [Bacteroidetes bacterium RIFCSPLOWO2_02_FULL_36_8]|nr:MAG: 2-C-methyl-D-erythritol 4-phosphate cytidylyltransferase [Bacteroidetes bacterium RIFCSPLOWO2_02_FULL_36_8]OFY72239.1 MAG: 2-C-methyl-D-erythritol 4-phosphate cytidylyltransferase [Bacteroidetes bacterium RIFCSPLOWO2_12_FULL_37_12]